MNTRIYIAVSGGVVQGVRATKQPHRSDGYDCRVVDYDNNCEVNDDGETLTDEEFERQELDGKTWAEIEKETVGVF